MTLHLGRSEKLDFRDVFHGTSQNLKKTHGIFNRCHWISWDFMGFNEIEWDFMVMLLELNGIEWNLVEVGFPGMFYGL